MAAQSNPEFVAVILAGGHGTRMKSRTPKALHRVLGRPMVAHVIRAAAQSGCSRAVVVEKDGAISNVMGTSVDGFPVTYAAQDVPLGTGDAVRCTLPHLRAEDVVVILNADLPCITADAIRRLMQAHIPQSLVVATSRCDDPGGYGRIVRSENRVVAIVEAKDATDEQLAIQEVNQGLYVVGGDVLAELIPQLGNSNAQGEFYLTDLVHLLAQSGRPADGIEFDNSGELMGVNDRVQLAEADASLRGRVLKHHMEQGVTIEDPARTVVEDSVEIGADTVLEVDVTLRGATRIGRGCHIGQGSILTNAVVGNNVTVLPYSIMDDAVVDDGARVGPFARLRPGSHLCAGSRVGNFVELKKTRLGAGSKANHLSYLGDAEIGEGVNVGAGTITCNYDGTHKYKTVMEDGVFIGSDTQIVAPVTVGKGAYVGAGTTVTEDVPAGALAISRTPQVNKEGWVERKTRDSGEKES